VAERSAHVCGELTNFLDATGKKYSTAENVTKASRILCSCCILKISNVSKSVRYIKNTKSSVEITRPVTAAFAFKTLLRKP